MHGKKYKDVGADREKSTLLDYAFPNRKAEVKEKSTQWYRGMGFKTKEELEKERREKEQAEAQAAEEWNRLHAQTQQQINEFNAEEARSAKDAKVGEQLVLKIGCKRVLSYS
jgi:hypothetical protein